MKLVLLDGPCQCRASVAAGIVMRSDDFAWLTDETDAIDTFLRFHRRQSLTYPPYNPDGDDPQLHRYWAVHWRGRHVLGIDV